MSIILEEFSEFQDAGVPDTAAAILVLASVIDRKPMLDRQSGENFGHELAVALKNVLEEKSFQIHAEVNRD
jgi:hypothetical protein